MVAPHMDFLAQTPEWAPLTQGRSNLAEWLARMSARRSMQLTTWDCESTREGELNIAAEYGIYLPVAAARAAMRGPDHTRSE